MIPTDRMTMREAAILAYGKEYVEAHPRCEETIRNQARAGRLKSIKVTPSRKAARFTCREWVEQFLLDNAKR